MSNKSGMENDMVYYFDGMKAHEQQLLADAKTKYGN